MNLIAYLVDIPKALAEALLSVFNQSLIISSTSRSEFL